MSYYHYQSKKSTVPVKTVPTLDVIAAAVMAFHANGDKVEKNDIGANAGSVEYDIPATPAIVSNKTRANAILENPELIPQAAKDEAQEVIQFLQGQLTMSVLTGAKISDFVRDMGMAMEEETVPAFKVGLLVYAPNAFANGKKREVISEATIESMYTSQPLGTEGAKVTVNFTLLDKRYVQAFDCYSAYGKDEHGNLVSFLTKHENLAANGTYTAKVKKAENDKWHNNAMVTSLNYLKAAK
jgi:hypothetical protein